MTDLRKAAEMALEALDGLSEPYDVLKAQEALRQALAQPVDAVNMKQERVDETAKREHEPYGYVWTSLRDGMEVRFSRMPPNKFYSPQDIKPVYTAPPKREWVGLTDDEMQEAGRYSYCRGGTSEKLYHIMWNSQPSASVGWCRAELIAFAQTIEAKLKEKNT